MVFVADDLGAWLVGLLADAGRKKLTALVLGSDQERALRKAAADAVQDTAAEINLSAEQARRLATVIRKAFRKPVQDAPLAGSVTMLELLQAGIAGQLAVLDDAGRTAAGQSSVEVLEVPGDVLAEKLTGHLVREIMLRGSGGGPLTPLADQLNHDLTHLQGQRVEGMLARLVALIMAASAPSADAGGPFRDVGPTRPVRVSEADPRRLGVHAAISVPGVPGVPEDVPPEYVPRDVDIAERGIRAMVAAAAERGGFVLLVGGSSTGKTRCAVEAVKAALPDWWLVHPAGSAEVAQLAQAPSPQTVVWLDELQRYLDGEHGLTGAAVRALLNALQPVVVIGTLWPDLYTAYTAVPEPGGDDPRARERQVLDLATVIRIGSEFSPAEQGRARAAAARDRRLAVALEAAGDGLTQTLAAAPQLVARWEDAQTASPYAWAVLTAALDLTRLGARAPLSPDLLRAAAPGYCTSQQQAEAPVNWFEQAMAHARGKLYGATAALNPAGIGMGQLAGYTAADYLLQYASRERRSACVPASSWDATLSDISDRADTARLAYNAENRLLYRYAIPLYRRCADVGDTDAAWRLADLLARRGDVDGAVQVLRARADAGDTGAAWRLAELLAERGDVDGLRARADAGDTDAARRLAGLLAERGDVDGLRGRADAGDADAARRLAELLAERGDVDGLRGRADTGDTDAARRLAELLEKRGDVDGAVQVLRGRADVGDTDAAWRLADLLARRGDVDGAVQVLRGRADVGDTGAAWRLAELLAERGDVDGLRARADAGDTDAARRLAGLLADLLEKRGDVDGAVQVLRARADAGDTDAAWRLAGLLAERGDVDGLRGRADAGDTGAAWRLAELLEKRGDVDGAEQVLRAHVGEYYGAVRLAELLKKGGDLDGAEQVLRADAADDDAAEMLVKLLAERGDLDGAEQVLHSHRFGDWHDAEYLADLLTKQRDVDGLLARADAGDTRAARRLAGLLAERGDVDGLRGRADAGDTGAAWRLAELLEKRGDLAGVERVLRAQVDAGDTDAGERLAKFLTNHGRDEEAKQLRQFGLNPDGSIASA